MIPTKPRGENGSAFSDDHLQTIKKELHKQLVSALDLSAVGVLADDELRAELRHGAEELCSYRAELLNHDDRRRLIEEVVDETVGLGPMEPLLRDPEISDILVNGPDTVYVERQGRLERTNVRFHDDQHLLEIVQRMANRIGRRLDESSPMVDARLPDGSRVNAVINPLALDGALVSIRRSNPRPLLAGDLLAFEAATPAMIEFLAACVKARLNIVISGGTGSGKTTLLNMLSGYIPAYERVVTIEDAAELKLQQPHVARMETRPKNLEGSGEVTARDLVRNSLRMRPDRIVVGECRGAEAFDMLQAMNTGHDGSLTTIHANDTRDAISRLEMLVGMADMGLPLWFIHRQIASAVHIVVQAARLSGGKRKIVQISEVTGVEGETIALGDVFRFVQTGIDEDDVVQGHFEATGLVPQCATRLAAAGVALPPETFENGTAESTHQAR